MTGEPVLWLSFVSGDFCGDSTEFMLLVEYSSVILHYVKSLINLYSVIASLFSLWSPNLFVNLEGGRST